MNAKDLAEIKKLYAKFQKENGVNVIANVSVKPKGDVNVNEGDNNPSENSDWSDVLLPSIAPLKAALESSSAHLESTRNIELLEIASDFYSDLGYYDKSLECIELWEKADKTSLAPIIRHLEFYYNDLLPYEEFLNAIKEGLKREPKSSLLYWLGYHEAFEKDDSARRLYYAGELATITRNPDHLFLYGFELGRNLMLEKAQKIFTKGLKGDNKHIGCLNGLGKCYMETLNLDDAENVFERSFSVDRNTLANSYIRAIGDLRKGKSWAEIKKKQAEVWRKLQDKQAQAITKEHQGRMLAEFVAG